MWWTWIDVEKLKFSIKDMYVEKLKLSIKDMYV